MRNTKAVVGLEGVDPAGVDGALAGSATALQQEC